MAVECLCSGGFLVFLFVREIAGGISCVDILLIYKKTNF